MANKELSILEILEDLGKYCIADTPEDLDNWEGIIANTFATAGPRMKDFKEACNAVVDRGQFEVCGQPLKEACERYGITPSMESYKEFVSDIVYHMAKIYVVINLARSENENNKSVPISR